MLTRNWRGEKLDEAHRVCLMTGSTPHHDARPTGIAWVVSTVEDDGGPGAGKHVTCIFLTVGILCIQFPCPILLCCFLPQITNLFLISIMLLGQVLGHTEIHSTHILS